MTKPLGAMTKTGEKLTITPYITSRDVKILSREPYTNGGTSGIKMSVEVARTDSDTGAAVDLRAVTTGKLERTKMKTGYQVLLEYEIKFFRPANSTTPVATTRTRATMECEENLTPAPAFSAFIWDRFKITVDASQPSIIVGIVLRDSTVEVSIEQLVESHWDSGEDPINGFYTFINHVNQNSESYDIMRFDDATLSELSEDL